MEKQQETVQVSTWVSQDHRIKLDRMKDSGLQINRVIEQGIDAVYAQMVAAGVIERSHQAPALKEAA